MAVRGRFFLGAWRCAVTVTVMAAITTVTALAVASVTTVASVAALAVTTVMRVYACGVGIRLIRLTNIGENGAENLAAYGFYRLNGMHDFLINCVILSCNNNYLRCYQKQ